MNILTLPPTFYEFGFNAPPNQNVLPSYWQDLSARVQWPWTSSRGRDYELDTNETGTWTPTGMVNFDGALDPSNASSPFAPNVQLYRGFRIRCKPGPNLLTPDQANCGQSSPYPLGNVPTQLGVTNDYGYQVSLASSGTAFTGSQVYQVTLPNGAVQYTTVVIMPAVPVVPGEYYSFTAQVSIPSGNTVGVSASATFYGAGGTQLSIAGGAVVTVTSGSSSWTTITVTGQAPTGTAWAQYAALKVQVGQAGALTANTVFQVGALQWEQSAAPTPWQEPFTVSRNLFPQVIATGSAAMNPITDAVSNWWYQTQSGGSIAQDNFLTAPASGQTSALAWTTPSGTTSTSGALWVGYNSGNLTGPVPDNVQVTAGTTYTASVYVSRASSADATVAIELTINWFNSAGVSVGTTVGGATTVPVATTWARASVSGAAPSGAVWGRISEAITTPASTTATNTIYHTGYQFEAAGAATTWYDCGPTYFIIVGGIERWPETWTEQDGTYGISVPVGVDVFAGLSQPTLLDPFVQEVLALGPNFYYTLGDAVGSSQVVDSAGKRPAAPIENSPFGVGSLVLGGSVTSTSPTGGMGGYTGTVATFDNPSVGSASQEPETFVSIHKTTTSPGPPVNGNWTRIIHFNSSTIPSDEYMLWESLPGTYYISNSYFAVGIFFTGTSGVLFVDIYGITGTEFIYEGATNLCDGNWHQFAITCSSTGAITLYVDGVSVSTGTTVTLPFAVASSDVVGASVRLGQQVFHFGTVGDLAHVVEIPSVLTQAQITNLYNSFRTASTGDTPGARFQRVLNWLGYGGPTSIQPGSTASMGPATDIAGSAALDGLNAIALTENGNTYVSNGGVLTFQGRAARYNSRVPLFTFGEGAPEGSYGEWPCEISQFDFDPSLLGNNIQVTQYSTNNIFTANGTASQQAYFERTYERTINTTSNSEPQDAANYLLSRYQQPLQRTDVITLHPSAVPGLMNVCLQLDIGTRIRVIRRPGDAPAVTVDCFVEKVDWAWDPNEGDVVVQLQASPANLANYWQLAALHTTLNTQATSGTNTATINALPDAAVNALASSLPQGYSLTFDPGTPIQETLTIAPPLPATGIGYSTAALTFTTNFTYTHAAGAVVCEPLPTGYTNPATWDPASLLGTAYTTFATAASSGTNTITVSMLPDYKANALASDWNTGDLLSLSPGTANWEGYNMLTPNQSTAGEGVLPLAVGTAGATIGVMSALATLAVTASATAWQGANVWQGSIGASGTSGFRLLRVVLAAVPGQVYSASFYVRSTTSGANPQVAAQLLFTNAAGGSLATTNGTTVTLTGSATAAWTRVTVSATAPAQAAWLQAGVPLAATGPSSAWTFQADGLQLEPNAAPSTYQTCPQIQSVSASVPGYSTATITLANNLASNHALGDYVTDPLPAGTANPSTYPATTRIAY